MRAFASIVFEPMIPFMNATGRKTATMDDEAAITAKPTSDAPFCAASMRPSPSSMCRKMFSSTTIASSITRPTARERASMVMLLTVKPRAFVATNAPINARGMVITLISVILTLRRKTYMMMIVNRTPNPMSIWTPRMDSLMNSDES